MTVIVDKNKCTGCEGLEFPRCVEYCPGDLMALNEKENKAFIWDEEDCWDCMVCVKACPHQAITTKLPYQVALYKATLKPRVTSDRIKWKLEDLAGNKEEFEIKTKEF